MTPDMGKTTSQIYIGEQRTSYVHINMFLLIFTVGLWEMHFPVLFLFARLNAVNS